MEKLLKAKRLYFKELDDQVNNMDKNIFQIGGKNLINKLNEVSKGSEPSDGKIFRKKFRLNKKWLDFDYNSLDDIILPFDYEYGEYKQGNFIPANLKSEKTKNNIDNNKIFDEFDEDLEDKEKMKNKNEDKKEEKIKNNVDKNIFEEEIIPSDDELIGKPPIITVEVSDIDLQAEEFEEEDEAKSLSKNDNKILISNVSPVENNLQFTDHILNQVKSPIDMLTVGEKVYELINKKDNSKEIIDLSPLNTYKKKNRINVQLFKYLNIDRKYNQFIQSSKLILDDYISSEQKEEVPTTMFVDNRDYLTNCSIWFGTNKAKLIRIPICNKPSKECQGMVFVVEEVGISCMDISENYLIIGHIDGTIQIWEDQKIIDKIKDIKSEILQVKFIKINPKKKKYEFICSDANGNVNYVKRAKIMLMSRNLNESISSNKEFPIYKICLFSNEKDLKIIKKKNILMVFVSLKNVSLYKKRPKNEFQCISKMEIPYCNVGDFVFDCDFGYGFPPIPELNFLNENEKKRKISLIENALVEENKKEKLLFVVSYGVVIRLFEIDLNANYSTRIIEIGHYINESPVCKLGFINNSFLNIIDNKRTLKIINTFCFENEKYKVLHSPTNNNIIYYDNIELSDFDILKQNNIFFNNLKDGKRCSANTNFIGSALIFEQNIFIITKKKFLLYKLNRWDEIISELCHNEEYKKMIWLSTFLLGKNKNLFKINKEENIEKEYDQALQESLYIFLIKGMKEDNNYKELRMLIEYCLRTERFKDFYKAKETLYQRKLEKYLYEYTTEYIFNGNFYKYEFDINFLKDFINYYLSKHEIILLSKILLKIDANNLNHPDILKMLEENEIINPFIYANIREKNSNKSDYFKPIEYLFKLFEKKIKEGNKENKKEINKIKDEYFKLITEHDMKYYYDKTLTCNDYIGHKLLWYINKCLKNEDYPKGNLLPNEAFEETCKKIFLFLTLNNVIEILLQFDSFSYFKLLTKIFTEYKIYKMMDLDIDKKKYPFESLESFIKSYLGNISIESLSEKYLYYQVKLFIDKKIKHFKNEYFIKYDFYQMTAEICNKRRNNMIYIDRETLIEAIKFFINYEINLEGDKSKNFVDPFNCHKIPKKDEILYKEFSENIENNILYLLKCLQGYQDFFETDLDDLYSSEGLKYHNKIKIYLSEYGKKFDELFMVKLEEYHNKDPILSREQKLKNFFKWINDTLDLTDKIDSKSTKIKYHPKFKDFLKTQFTELCKISVEDLYNILNRWFNEDLKDICFSLGSDELKYVFLDKYIAYQNFQEEKDKNYDDYLMMKLELLIKKDYKEQIIKIVENNRYLWDNKYLDFLIRNEVYDAAIFISQKRDNIDNCIKLTEAQIKKLFVSIKKSLNNYTEKVNSDVIFIKLEEIKKYLDLGLNACASWTEANKNYTMTEVKNTWLKPLDLFYQFKNELNKINKNKQFSMKIKSKIFKSIFDKIEQNILENIEYILSKMNDYIPLSYIVDVLCEMFKKAKFKEYSKMFQRMFYSTRRSEDIFRSILNLWFNSVSNAQNNLLIESKKGLCCDTNECYFCNKPINESGEIEKLIYFHCGHIYHTLCCAIEKGKYACYICRMNDLEGSMYKDIPNLAFRKKKNSINNDNENKDGKKKKEDYKRKKILAKLKKINNKRLDKIENFKENIDNIKI